MATKKITLNELRNLVKQIIKEDTENNTAKTIRVTRDTDNFGGGGRIHIKDISPSLLEDMVVVVGMLRELSENDKNLLSGEEFFYVKRIYNEIKKITN